MEPKLISELQPLFCSRSSLLKAQGKLTDNPKMDCQLVIRFDDGSVQPLPLKRTDVESLLACKLYSVEKDINSKLTTTEEETETISTQS